MPSNYIVSLQESQLDKSRFSGMKKPTQNIETSQYYSQELSDLSADSDVEQDSEYYTAHGHSIFSQLRPKKSLPSDTEHSSDSEDSVSYYSESIVTDWLLPIPKKLLKCHQSTPIKTQRTEKEGMLNKTSDIVYDLVMQRYEGVYNNLLKKLRKSKLTVDEDKYITVVAEMKQIFEITQDKGSNSILKNLAQEKVNKSQNNYFVEKVVSTTEEEKISTCDDSALIKYDEMKEPEYEEINEEEGKTYFRCSTASIRTDQISQILSSTSSYENSYHHNTADNTADISQQPDLIREPFRYSYASYQDVTSMGMEIYSDEGRSMIKNHIYINEVIMEQAKKMLKYGQRKMGFMGSPVHLEGERIMLLSKTRREVLMSHLNRVPEVTGEAMAQVTIENLRCVLNSDEERPPGQDYYICVLTHKTTVYSTKIGMANQLGWVDFGGFFMFDNVSNTFNIKIQLYRVHVPKRKLACIALNFMKKRKLSTMQLVGEATIGMLNIRNKKFTFRNAENVKSREHKLFASIEATLNWPDVYRDFLSIGTGDIGQQPLWNIRWCVLQDTQIKYYSNPSDEQFCKPMGVIDLQDCKICDVTDTFLGKKTICLLLGKNSELKRIFISVDDAVTFEEWLRNIQVTLQLIREWI